MGNCLGLADVIRKGNDDTEDSSNYGSSHIGTVTGKRYSTVRIENLYQLDGLIGRGQSGLIHLCHNKRTGDRYACKSLLKQVMKSEGTTDDTRREVQVLGMLKGHPNVVKLEGVFEDATSVHIIMELCTGGSLTEYITSQGEYSERAAASALCAVLGVVQHCHSLGIVHRDVKLSNFLLSDQSDAAIIKAIDFGSATFCEPGEILHKMAGTPLYVAPEVLEESYSFPCDVWSTGVMLYIMLCGRPPFSGGNVLEVFDAVRSQPVDLLSEPWGLISAEAKGLVSAMLQKDPSARPTAEQLLRNPWVQGQASAEINLASTILPRMARFSKISKLRHLARLATSRFIPAEKMQEIHAVFEAVDADGSGALSLPELRKGLEAVGAHLSDKEVEALFAAADMDNSGTIDYPEFVAATVKISEERDSNSIRRAFQEIDKEGKGAVSFDDMAQFCSDRNLASKEEVKELLSSMAKGTEGDSTSGTGFINYDDFVEIVTGRDEHTRAWSVQLI